MANPLYAVVNPSHMIINLIAWDGVTTYDPTPNTLALATDQPNAQIGGTYISGVFTAPATPAPAQGIVFVNSPNSGATIALPNPPQPQATLYCYLQPTVPLASLTIAMPPGPLDGDVLNLLSSQAITAISFVPTFQGAPTTLAGTAAGAKSFTYSAQLGNWFYW